MRCTSPDSHKVIYHHQDRKLLEKFYVISVISNPIRFTSRYELYQKFRDHMEDSGVNLITVELQQGERAFQITEAGNPRHLQLRTFHELWHKENMINLGLAKLPRDWEYVAWVDADLYFQRTDWAIETVQQLQHNYFVQMFQTAIDLGPTGESLQIHHGFVWSYLNGRPAGKDYMGLGHPGYAWAARREAIDFTGQLLDMGILGAGDRHMALSLIGRAESSFSKHVTSEYARHVLRWQDRCEKYIKRDIGYVPGTILHGWHGRKKDRGYQDRWQILIKNEYDPELDLMRDWQGLYQLTDRSIKLRDDIRRYFRSRQEDSIDLV